MIGEWRTRAARRLAVAHYYPAIFGRGIEPNEWMPLCGKAIPFRETHVANSYTACSRCWDRKAAMLLHPSDKVTAHT